MKILVIGGTGLVGSYLLPRLVENNNGAVAESARKFEREMKENKQHVRLAEALDGHVNWLRILKSREPPAGHLRHITLQFRLDSILPYY